jgi:uncharacterized membrane protein (DUF106 family)
MVPSQLEKLKKDARELEHHIIRMKKEGRSDKVSQLQMKKMTIDKYIGEITNNYYY